MSEAIYREPGDNASENFVCVAQACKGVLTKRNFANGTQVSYDHVKYFNFFEERIESLDNLFSLSKRMLAKPRCCYLRCRIKDHARRRNVVRRSSDRSDGEATLVPHRCNWFCIDVDGFKGESFGDLATDTRMVIMSLPSNFHDVECFSVATGSYGIKPGIRLRLFYWSTEMVGNQDLSRFFHGNQIGIDPSIYQNPVQLIYTAAPLFYGLNDPVKQRIVWIAGKYASVNIPSINVHQSGMPEIVYTKREAEAHANKAYLRLGMLSIGERHNGLIACGLQLGKLVGQGHFEREEVIQRMYNCCNFWYGKREPEKDMATIIWAVDKGIAAMDKGEAAYV